MGQFNTGGVIPSSINTDNGTVLLADVSGNLVATPDATLLAADYLIYDFRKDGESVLALNVHPKNSAARTVDYSSRGAATINDDAGYTNVGGDDGFGEFAPNLATLIVNQGLLMLDSSPV